MMNNSQNKRKNTQEPQPSDTEHHAHQTKFPRTFDPKSEAGIQRFREVCKELWVLLYDKGCKQSNYPFYHSCCNTFSRKTYAKGQHHHPEQTTHKMSTWLAYHKITDSEEFTTFLLEQTKQRNDGFFTVPGLNLPHNCDYPLEKFEERVQKRTEALEKRKKLAEDELTKANELANKFKKLYEKEQKQREEDKLVYDMMILRLKQQGRLLPPPSTETEPERAQPRSSGATRERRN